MQSSKSNLLSIKSILDNNSEILLALCTRASGITRLQNNLCVALGEPLALHVKVANYNNETLVLHTDSPAWASRLRFKIPEILDFVNKNGMKNLHSIRIKVIQNVYESPEITRKITISDSSSQLIRDTAQSINDDILRQSLLRLGGHKS